LNIQASAVPEPSAQSLFLLGLGGMLGMRVFRRKEGDKV
jgi:PEP-CTERM motif